VELALFEESQGQRGGADDRQRAELGSFRLTAAPGSLPRLMRRLRALIIEAHAAKVREGDEPVRLTVALFPTRSVPAKAPSARTRRRLR
jgi:hypothetical protein